MLIFQVLVAPSTTAGVGAPRKIAGAPFETVMDNALIKIAFFLCVVAMSISPVSSLKNREIQKAFDLPEDEEVITCAFLVAMLFFAALLQSGFRFSLHIPQSWRAPVPHRKQPVLLRKHVWNGAERANRFI